MTAETQAVLRHGVAMFVAGSAHENRKFFVTYRSRTFVMKVI
jgi:hypothetical protein